MRKWKTTYIPDETMDIIIKVILNYSLHFTRKSLRWVCCSGGVRRDSLLVDGLKACYWWKAV
jgi:hypothetical protein